jgi:hypothetical protein
VLIASALNVLAVAVLGFGGPLHDPRPVSAEANGILHTGALVGVDKSSVTFKLKPKGQGRVVRGFEFPGIPMNCDDPDYPDGEPFGLGNIDRIPVRGRRFKGRTAGGTALGHIDYRVEGRLKSGGRRAHGRVKATRVSKLIPQDPLTCRSGWVKWRTHRAG